MKGEGASKVAVALSALNEKGDVVTLAAGSFVGIKGTRIKNMFDGMCVNTIVFTSPMRADSHAATGKENADSTPVQKKNIPTAASDRPNLLNSHSAISDCTANPLPKESMLNSAASL